MIEMAKIRALLHKYREIVLYVIFGGLTTAVSVASFWLFIKFIFLGQHGELIANALSWVISVAFAFITNKLFVFESKSFKPAIFFPELGKFTAGRVITGLLEEAIIFVSITLLNPDAGNLYKLIWKIAATIIVIILNYVISKLLVFRGKKNETEES